MRLPVPIIVGPTAGGKTALAIDLVELLRARGVEAEVVSADSALIFRDMQVGTAKPTQAERRGVRHHLIDMVDPQSTETFTVHDWLVAATGSMEEMRSRGVLPVVVGGTNLYVKGLLEGMFEGPGADAGLRATLAELGPEALRARLERVDPEAASRIHANDLRRTIRALEVFELTGTPISSHQRQWIERSSAPSLPRPGVEGGAEGGAAAVGVDPRYVLIGLEWSIESINRRINARVRHMMAAGLEAEAHGLWSAGRLGPQACEALGYKQLIAAFHEAGSRGLPASPLVESLREDAVEKIKIETRRFAKNQRTWLRRLRMSAVKQLWIKADDEPVDGWASRALGVVLDTAPGVR